MDEETMGRQLNGVRLLVLPSLRHPGHDGYLLMVTSAA